MAEIANLSTRITVNTLDFQKGMVDVDKELEVTTIRLTTSENRFITYGRTLANVAKSGVDVFVTSMGKAARTIGTVTGLLTTGIAVGAALTARAFNKQAIEVDNLSKKLQVNANTSLAIIRVQNIYNLSLEEALSNQTLLREEIEKVSRLRLAPRPEDIKSARDASIAWRELKVSVSDTAGIFGSVFAPIITPVLRLLTGIATVGKSVARVFVDVGASVVNLLSVLTPTGNVLTLITASLRTIGNVAGPAFTFLLTLTERLSLAFRRVTKEIREVRDSLLNFITLGLLDFGGEDEPQAPTTRRLAPRFTTVDASVVNPLIAPLEQKFDQFNRKLGDNLARPLGVSGIPGIAGTQLKTQEETNSLLKQIKEAIERKTLTNLLFE